MNCSILFSQFSCLVKLVFFPSFSGTRMQNRRIFSHSSRNFRFYWQNNACLQTFILQWEIYNFVSTDKPLIPNAFVGLQRIGSYSRASCWKSRTCFLAVWWNESREKSFIFWRNKSLLPGRRISKKKYQPSSQQENLGGKKSLQTRCFCWIDLQSLTCRLLSCLMKKKTINWRILSLLLSTSLAESVSDWRQMINHWANGSLRNCRSIELKRPVNERYFMKVKPLKVIHIQCGNLSVSRWKVSRITETGNGELYGPNKLGSKFEKRTAGPERFWKIVFVRFQLRH